MATTNSKKAKPSALVSGNVVNFTYLMKLYNVNLQMFKGTLSLIYRSNTLNPR